MVSKVETNSEDFTDFEALHTLLREAFDRMVGRIDPPSSMTRTTAADLAEKARQEDLYLINENDSPVACLFAVPRNGAYYIGKMAVAPAHRGKGLARQLILAAAARARLRGLSALKLQTRVELLENHAAFAALGFEEVGRTAHPGYARPTSVTFRRPL